MADLHWTERSIEDFTYSLSSSFAVQLETRLEENELLAKQLAERVGSTSGRVSQVLNNPGNLSLKSMAKYARAAGLKVAIVLYDDSDADNSKGPILGEIFAKCWEKCGKPEDFFELEAKVAGDAL